MLSSGLLLFLIGILVYCVGGDKEEAHAQGADNPANPSYIEEVPKSPDDPKKVDDEKKSDGTKKADEESSKGGPECMYCIMLHYIKLRHIA